MLKEKVTAMLKGARKQDVDVAQARRHRKAEVESYSFDREHVLEFTRVPDVKTGSSSIPAA